MMRQDSMWSNLAYVFGGMAANEALALWTGNPPTGLGVAFCGALALALLATHIVKYGAN